MGGAQGNSAAIQAQKAQEREATQLQPFYLENIVHNNKQISLCVWSRGADAVYSLWDIIP